MKKISLLITLFIIYGFSHKYYVSTSLYDFKQDSGSLQITIRVFQDDFTEIIKKKYQVDISLNNDINSSDIQPKISDYLLSNLSIYLDNNEYDLFYLGSELKNEMIIAYLELEDFPEFKSIELKNTILFDLFETQQNIIHLKKGVNKRSFILRKDVPNVSFEF